MPLKYSYEIYLRCDQIMAYIFSVLDLLCLKFTFKQENLVDLTKELLQHLP